MSDAWRAAAAQAAKDARNRRGTRRTGLQAGRVLGVRARPATPTLPARLRRAVYERDEGRCFRCGGQVPLAGVECHHRWLRSAGRYDCPCNLLPLHPACHRWVHDHPAESRGHGWLLSGHGPRPSHLPAQRASPGGRLQPVTLHCDGRWETTA